MERATPWVRSPLWPPAPYCLGRCHYNVSGWNRSHSLPALSRVWQHVKLSNVSLETRPRYSLVVDKDVKKATKQTKAVSRWPGQEVFCRKIPKRMWLSSTDFEEEVLTSRVIFPIVIGVRSSLLLTMSLRKVHSRRPEGNAVLSCWFPRRLVLSINTTPRTCLLYCRAVYEKTYFWAILYNTDLYWLIFPTTFRFLDSKDWSSLKWPISQIAFMWQKPPWPKLDKPLRVGMDDKHDVLRFKFAGLIFQDSGVSCSKDTNLIPSSFHASSSIFYINFA